jgi:hypothetical protein
MEIQVPIMGYVLMPIIFLMVLFRRQYLAHVGIVVGGLNATSILNVFTGSVAVGIQPSVCVALLAIALAAIGPRRREAPQGPAGSCKHLMIPLFVFAGYAAVSSVAMPLIFAQYVAVPNPRAGYGSAIPLEFSTTNINQTLYVLAFTLLTYLIAADISRDGRAIRGYLTALLMGIFLVSAITAYQATTVFLPLPFPKEIFHSNPSYNMMGLTIADRSVFSGLLRLSGPFPEPSKLAHFLSGSLFLLLFLPKSPHSPKAWLRGAALGLVCIDLLLCVSTTAVVCLFGGFVLKAATIGYHALRRRRQRGLVMQGLIAVLVISTVLLWLSWYLPEGVRNDTVEAYLFGKLNTESAATRIAVDKICLDVALQTAGIGAGWGSVRGSTLIPTTLGNVGVAGFCLLVWFVVGLKRPKTRGPLDAIGGAAGWSLIGFLMAHSIAVADLTLYTEFAILGVYVGLKARGVNWSPRISRRRPTAIAMASRRPVESWVS